MIVKFTTIIEQFKEQGEKTGWTYINIASTVAQQLKPGNKKSFRVKGKLDDHAIEQVALIPMGEGDFIMPLNATFRKAIKKNKGASVTVQLEVDNRPKELPAEFVECLQDEPEAYQFFKSLPNSHQTYFGNWISSAKTDETKAKRIAQSVSALAKKWNYGIMQREIKKNKEAFDF
jgi:hypothetical protein